MVNSSPTQEKNIQNSSPTEDSPFFPPLPFGSDLIAEYECICDYDFYDTGEESRKDGCGGTYYRRIYVSPSGIVHNERTPCKCVLEYQEKMRETELKKKKEQERSLLAEKIQKLFSGWDMLLDEAYSHMRFEKFKPETESQEKTFSWLKKWTPENGSFCLSGLPGRGKTHLALAAARKAKYMQYTVLSIKSINLLNRLRRCYSSSNEELEIEVMDVLKRVEVLVIDDIGTEKPTGWVLEKLYEIIDSRHGKSSLTTIFTTNLDGEEMQRKLGAALTSRIYGTGKLFTVEGRDHRIQYNPWADLGELGEI